MIRLIFSLLTLLSLACSEVESLDVNTNVSPELPLDISVSTMSLTKGELVENPEDMGSIGLYCAKTGVGYWSSTTEFSKLNNRRFYITGDGDWVIDGESESWDYESFSDRYTFFAYSPYYSDTQGVTPRIEDGELVIDYVVPTSSLDQPDLMFAEPLKDVSPQITGSVPLLFYHALSSVSFEVISSLDLRIIAIDIADVVNEGSLTWDYESNAPLWSLGTSTDEEFEVDVDHYTIDYENAVQVNTDKGYLMMIPQLLTDGAEVILTLENYEQKSLVIPAGSEWTAGSQYNYIIKLDDDGSGFIFNSKQISNCYIINPTQGKSTTVQIPIEDRINDFWMNYEGDEKEVITSSSDLTTLYVEMVWEDFDGDVVFDSEVIRDSEEKVAVRLTFNSTYQEGNFVFAVQSPTTLWSWHLWFTDYDPDAIAAANRYNIEAGVDKAYTLSGCEGAVHRYKDASTDMNIWSGMYSDKFIMDRNIGERNTYASDYGAGSVYYEFGRKDPFPGNGAKYGSASSLLYGKSQPGVRQSSGFSFSRAVELSYDYIISSSSSSDNWSVEEVARSAEYIWFDGYIPKSGYTKGKSIFDPSPLGWRVPVSDTWSAFNTTTSDQDQDQDLDVCSTEEESVGKYNYYGYRNPNNSAILSQAQEVSYVWSASQVDHQTGACAFFSDTLASSPVNLIVTYGLPVRAIQE